MVFAVFFFNDTATTEIYTLSLHDALPICQRRRLEQCPNAAGRPRSIRRNAPRLRDRKSTRLNSSHLVISYAVFCLKKKTPFLAGFAAGAAGFSSSRLASFFRLPMYTSVRF